MVGWHGIECGALPAVVSVDFVAIAERGLYA